MNRFLSILSIALAISTQALAGDVAIRSAEFQASGNNIWPVNVTLQHADTGWDHYADNWRVVDEVGTVLGDRVLYHPHDTVHGWTAERLSVDLSQVVDGRLLVSAE